MYLSTHAHTYVVGPLQPWVSCPQIQQLGIENIGEKLHVY
jgi:hypothetical protein